MDDNDQYLQRLEKHADNLRSIKTYSLQRIDLLIISLSGAGIYTCFEIMKYINNDSILKIYHLISLPYKISGFLFTFAIIFNFVSQVSAYHASVFALESTKLDIFSRETKTDNLKESTILDYKAGRYNSITNIFNLFSIIAMLLGISTLMVFVSYLL